MGRTLMQASEIAPPIAKRGEEIDRAQRLPPDLFEELVRAGCYRMLAPASHGGDELALPEVLRVIETLSRGDGSVGWTIGQAAVAQVVFSYFPSATFDEIYADGPDVVGAGAVAPKGKALRIKGGWRVSGQWPFVSGCEQASWFYGQCVVFAEGAEQHQAEQHQTGIPTMRLMLFPMGEVRILDTWRVMGLRGTASHDVHVPPSLCPDGRSCSVIHTSPSVDRAIYRVPTVEYGGLIVAAVAVGIAQGAVDEVVELAAAGKRPAFSTRRLAESPVFHDHVGEAYMAVQAARALLYQQADEAWARALSGEPLPVVARAALRATAAEVTATAARAVGTAYTQAGGSTVYDSSPLQRRLRDIHTATQHAVTSRHSYGLVGSALVGETDESLLI
jgi:alkylation response protein AidB-like acyl-CoA dehydrogenase